MKLEFSRQIFEKYADIRFHEICPVEAELSCANGQTQTGLAKLVVAFRNFANASEN
jgi:hypothetical protein